MPKNKRKAAILAAFFCIYFVWGSTFLGIKYALETLPPFLIGAMRFISSGAILYLFSFREKGGRFGFDQIKYAAVTGLLFATFGNGLVIWGEQKIDSGIAALWVATIPIWVMSLNWVAFDRARPLTTALLGGFLGLVGIFLLARGGKSSFQIQSWPYILALLLAALSWSTGTLIQKRKGNSGMPLRCTSIQMLSGGLGFLVLAKWNGDFETISIAAVSTKSILALIYLALLGSVISFTAYTWLITVVHPQKVSTYALVNPVIALLVGSFWGNEIIRPEALTAALFVMAGVTLILFSRKPKVLPSRNAPLDGIP